LQGILKDKWIRIHFFSNFAKQEKKMTDAIINQFASYKALIKEAARFNNEKYHLKNLLSQPNRFESLCAKMDGFFLDYS